MYHNTDATYEHGSTNTRSHHATTAVRRSQRTVGGAVLTTLLLPVAVVAASYPVVAVVAATVGLFAARYAGVDTLSGGHTRFDYGRSKGGRSLSAPD